MLEPAGASCRVRINPQIAARGIAGFITRRFAPGMLLPLYAQELAHPEEYARRLAATGATQAPSATA